ncbi:site-specific integrase [Pseudomonas veronii]|uniref:Site-specific integrase n=1 Tax=Pseudomonas veronii TaxID=76761 RepID=A0A7Y0ZPJ6_PSEVE|nr:site-specific integrase [Pseudomonas veronii]SEB58869.1 hypothetical protein SAMN04490199_1828 [Pseudomonas marginalis]KRP82020.1 hypothetical protein TU80_05840 [Pseudomonas veronii]NMX95653.1 site-specific integrase [Pseudomonas veronii]OPK01069.1 hypothetical protein BZ164_30225 [Pseudomonas veronii]CAD0262746.1 conserved hypothetical protein [Pseudomonas veronii]
MPDQRLPDLTFRNVKYGPRETPLNLSLLLYNGGAATDIREFYKLVSNGRLGAPLMNRLPLIVKIHSVIQGQLAGGKSRLTAKSTIQSIREFYTWLDRNGQSPEIDSVAKLYISWTDHLLLRQRTLGNLKTATVAAKATTVGSILDQALDLTIGLYRRTSLPKRYNKKKVLGTQADKTKLKDSFEFGHALLDISNALTVEAIRGALPVKIQFRSGKVLEEWSGLRPASTVKYLIPNYGNSNGRRRVKENRERWEKDKSWRTRFPLINLRIQAEMLIFISQTGMNLAQVNRLKSGKCTYQSYLDGYQVRRVYKGRRQGEVEFEIFSDYRIIFERYLKWRKEIFQDDENGLLFPESSPQQRSLDLSPKFYATQKRCKALGVRYIPASELRKTRINWLVRTSHDPVLTAEIAQHTQETLLRIYDQPHHQSATVEISKFHNLLSGTYEPPSPGVCINPIATLEENAPKRAPSPNCANPAGCLFCTHHRDIDTADHIWSLASYRHYKTLELTFNHLTNKSEKEHPAHVTIERITGKLKQFKSSSSLRASWVSEALDLIDEGSFHPKWDGFIRLIEARE